jgi:uncharacterized membrane protein
MGHWVKVYICTLFVYMGLDYVWLGHVTARFYKSELGEIGRWAGNSLKPILWAAGIVYLIVPVAILMFVLPRVKERNLMVASLAYGFVFGAMVYGVYDMTNYAILAKWSLKLTLIDMAWGGVVCALVTLSAAQFDRLFS